jgi:hypothetical protein
MRPRPVSLLPLAAFCLLFLGQIAAQNSFQIIGTADKNDRPNRLIRTANGDFVMAGRVNNDAALYRFDCSGQILDSLRWDLAALSSFEEFFDVMELPNGDFLAVGTANITLQYNSGLAVRTDANLKVLAADTMDIFGKDAALLQLARSKSGTVYLSGTVAGEGLNFSDNFCVAFAPNSLTVKDSVTVFNYGLDYPLSLTALDDGSLLMSGMAPIGNIFDTEAIIRNRAFVRKFKTDGTMQWEHVVESGQFKNKFGRAYYSSAVQNPASGNIIATGNIFTGDTTSGNILDLHYTLLSPSGALLDDTVATLPGSQRLYQSLRYDGTGNPFFAVGDSTGNVPDIHDIAPLSTVFLDFNNQLYVFNTTANRDVSASIRSIVNVPDQRLAYTGSFYREDEDVFMLFPSLEVLLTVSGPTATVTQPLGPDYTYQWYNAGGAIPGATGTTYTSPVNGPHAVLVTDPQGCTGFVIVTLLAPLQAVLEITQDIHCHGDKTGEIDVTPLGGTPPHRYSLNGGPLQGSNTFSGLGAGTYVVKIVDSENAMFTAQPIVLTEPPQLVAAAVLMQNTLTVNASGGTPPLQYSLNGGPQQSGNSFSGLPPGDYVATVRDAYGCTALSNSVKVTSAAVEPGAAWGLSVSPNPSRDLFQISAANAPGGALRAALYDPSGRLLRSLFWETRGGRLDASLDLSELPSGVYTLWLSDGRDWGAVRLEVAR